MIYGSFKKKIFLRRLIYLLSISLVFLCHAQLQAGIVGDIDGDGQVGLPEAIYALQNTTGSNPNIPSNCSITSTGTWASGTNYVACDVVSQNGVYYICTQAHTASSPPPDTTNWAVLALGDTVAAPPYNSQKLRDLLSANNHVTLPAGTEWTVGLVDLGTGQSISGPGTIIKESGSPYALRVVGFNVTIRGVKFRPQNVSGQPNCDIKLGNGSADVQISDNYFWGTTYSAICAADDSAAGGSEYSSHAKGVLITDNIFYGYVRPLFMHSVDNLTIQGNVLHDTIRDAIRLRENDGYVIINGNQFYNIGADNTINETQDAIDTAWSGRKLVITNNVIRSTEKIGLDIKEVSGNGSQGSRSIIIAHNHISEAWGSGIVVYGDGAGNSYNHSILIEGNILEHNARSRVAGEAAVRVRGAARHITIANNHISFNYDRGITVQDQYGPVSDVKITGNTIANNGSAAAPSSHGVIVSGAANVIITDNIVASDPELDNSGNQNAGIVISSTTNLILRDNIVRCHPTVGQIFIDNNPLVSADNLAIDPPCP